MLANNFPVYVKRTVTCLIALSVSFNLLAQRPNLNGIERYDITKIPPSVLKIAIDETRRQTNERQFERWRKRFVDNNGISYLEPSKVNEYLAHNAEIIESVGDSLAQEQVTLASISRTINAIDSSVSLVNYQRLFPSDYAKYYYAKAVTRAITQYYDTLYNDFLYSRDTQVATLVRDRLNLIYSQTGEKFQQPSLAEFTEIFTKEYGNIAGLDPRKLVDRYITESAWKYITDNGRNVSLEIIPVSLRSNVRSSFSSSAANLEQEASKYVAVEFRRLSHGVEVLSQNQVLVTDAVTKIGQVLENDIRELEKIKQMGLNAASVTPTIQASVERLNKRISYLSNFANSYLHGSIDISKVRDEVSPLGIVRTLFPNEYQTIQRGIELINEKPTLSNAIDFANGVIGIGQTLGVDKKTLESVGRFVSFAKSAVQIGAGVGRVFAGDITGVFSIFSGLGSLFGGGPPPESAELQFMRQMADEMRQNFELIHKNMATINSNIISLHQLTLKGFEQTGRQLQSIKDELDFNTKLVTAIDSKVSYLIYKDFEACRAIDTKVYTWSEWIALHKETPDPLLNRVMTCSRFVNQPAQKRFFSIPYTAQIDFNSQNSLTLRERYEVLYAMHQNQYVNTFKYFQQVYREYPWQALTAAIFPVNLTNQNDFPVYELISRRIEPLEITFKEAFDDAIDCRFLSEFCEKYLMILDYYFIHSNFTGATEEHYLSNLLSVKDQAAMDGRRKNAIDQLLILKDLCTIALIQQATIAGHGLLTRAKYTFTHAGISNSEKLLLSEVLEKNQIFAKNFATMALHNSIRDKKAYRKIYYNFDSDPKENLKKLNALLVDRMIVDSLTGSGVQSLRVKLRYFSKDILVVAPTPEELQLNRMVYPSGLYSVLRVRDEVNSRLLDVAYPQFIPRKGALNRSTSKALFIDALE